MAATLSQDLKERIVRSVTGDELSRAETARRFAVSKSTVTRVLRVWKERGSVATLEHVPGRKPKLDDTHLAWLRKRVEESPFLSTYELTPMFNEAFPKLGVHRSTILRKLHEFGMSLKKRPRSRPSASRKA